MQLLQKVPCTLLRVPDWLPCQTLSERCVQRPWNRCHVCWKLPKERIVSIWGSVWPPGHMYTYTCIQIHRYMSIVYLKSRLLGYVPVVYPGLLSLLTFNLYVGRYASLIISSLYFSEYSLPPILDNGVYCFGTSFTPTGQSLSPCNTLLLARQIFIWEKVGICSVRTLVSVPSRDVFVQQNNVWLKYDFLSELCGMHYYPSNCCSTCNKLLGTLPVNKGLRMSSNRNHIQQQVCFASRSLRKQMLTRVSAQIDSAERRISTASLLTQTLPK